MGPRLCGALPEKSNVATPFATDTVTASFTGSSFTTPSLSM